MKERPILFSGPMVRAILEGRKTQTRRPVKPQPPAYIDELYGGELRQQAPYQLECHESGCVLGYGFEDDNGQLYQCPFGVPCDRLWVRETFMAHADEIAYAATDQHLVGCDRWRPSIHMPRLASRITLEVVGVRVERVQDISDADAQAEGVEPGCLSCGTNCTGVGGCSDCRTCYRDSFAYAWQQIYGAESWHANQWVWVVEFKRIEQESSHAH